MAFDTSPRAAPQAPEPAPYREPAINWADWGMRIVVFGSVLGLYLYWIWTIVETLVRALL